MKKMSRILRFIIFSFPLFSYAGVNLKNGNYFISYNDIISTSKGITLGLTRTYNSKSTKEGWFGYGWGTPYEVSLETSLDGSIIIYENGTGGKTRFTVKGSAESPKVSQAVAKILASIKKKSSLTADSEKDLVTKLTNDNFFRHKMAKAYGVEASIDEGTVMTSHNYGYQKLYVVKKGYKRVYESGLTQFFSKEGDLIASSEKNGYKIRLTRNKETNLVEKIIDSSGNQIFLTWNSDKKIDTLTSKGTKNAKFKYSGKNLINSVDINGLSYSYQYDSYHNLVQITDDKIKNKKMANIDIKYAPKTFFATEVSKRNGEISRYIYESNKSNSDLHYWTIVVKDGISGEPYANKYEYEHKRQDDGSQWLYRTSFITGADYKKNELSGGILRETINNINEQPIKITQGKKITEFEYEDGFMISKKSNDGEFVKLEYNKQFKKISKINNNEGWTTYEYNKKGELKKAVDKSGRAILLVYDISGKITKMVDQVKATKNILSFRYNSQGKPIEISMNELGKILVEYDNYGQVKKVDSKGGRQIASQVSEAFQNLLTIVRPAGVNLSI